MAKVQEKWAKVKKVRWLTPDIVSVWLFEPQMARRVKPGQFFGIMVPERRELPLRRPISIADVAEEIRLVFKVVGKGTWRLSQTRPGDEWNILGPLGKPAPMVVNRDCILCGGGVGAAPLLFLAKYLIKRNRLRVFLGAKSARDLILINDFRRLGVNPDVITEDGSKGEKGVVTELVERAVKGPGSEERRPKVIVFACGPKEMLKDLKERITDGAEVWAFFEERMGCGTGICYTCAVPKNQGGYIRLCQEGPVLPLKEVAFK
ncbi:MAG: dihydroorotate dehydrogenase electron transfer subunit [candidate division WOR-3 bacterium]